MRLARNIFYRLAPRWLTSDDGEKVLFSVGTIMDALEERVLLGLLARFPSYAPPDALTRIGRDRRIIRGINEPAATYAARLLPWLDDHRVRGNPWALMRQLRGYCGVAMRIRTVDKRGNWYTHDTDGTLSYRLNQGNWNWADEPSTAFSRFWVILYPSASLWTASPPWGDPALWDGAWGTPGYTWGTTATPDQIKSIRSIIREWKPAGTRCVKIIVAFDEASFDPTSSLGDPGMPDGLWAKPYKVVDGVAVPTRLSTARYWRGT